mgnify:CR=1 FL=1
MIKRRIIIAASVIMIAAKSLYPSYGKVVKVDRKKDTISIRDAYGNVWVWDGAEDWRKGDGVALLMYDNGTPNKIKDDKIIKIRYVG